MPSPAKCHRSAALQLGEFKLEGDLSRSPNRMLDSAAVEALLDHFIVAEQGQNHDE